MRRRLLVLTAIATALALAPATSSAGEMKDSWLTTKAKMAMVKDDRVKARRVKVETQDGIVTLRGKVATVDEKTAAGKSEYNGKTYYFCSPGCKAKFDQNPKQYVK